MTPRFIIVHHSLTRDSKTVSWDAIRKYHTVRLGWRDIGYHYGIELIGDTYEILMGRMPNENGAHTTQEGMNRKSLGICLIGNFDEIEVPPEQMGVCMKLIKFLQWEYEIPIENVRGHREFAQYKSCPGKLVDLSELRKNLRT